MCPLQSLRAANRGAQNVERRAIDRQCAIMLPFGIDRTEDFILDRDGVTIWVTLRCFIDANLGCLNAILFGQVSINTKGGGV